MDKDKKSETDNTQTIQTPETVPTKPRTLMRTIGASGTSIAKGHITGEEYNRRLQGLYALRMFDVMRKSSEPCHAALQMVKLPLLNLDRYIEPASDDENDQYIARFVDNQLFHNNINFHSTSREAMNFFEFGHAVAEKTYEPTEFEGKFRIGIKEIAFRKQTSINAWETRDGLPGIQQQLLNPADGGDTLRDIIREKLIYWTNDKEGDNHVGISVLRYAFRSWDMVDKISMIYTVALERAGIPTPVLNVPASASNSDEEAAAEQALRQWRANEESYIKLPEGWVLDKLDMSGQSVSEFRPAIEHFETNILLSVLGQFLMLGSGSGSGSRAVSEDHSKLFKLSEEAANRTFMDPIQEDLIKQLVDLNFSDLPNGYPKLKSARVQDDDVTSLASAMNSLTSAGHLSTNLDTEQYVRKSMHLPELNEEQQAEYEKQQKLKKEAAQAQHDAVMNGDVQIDPKTGKPIPQSPDKPGNPGKPGDKPKPGEEKPPKPAVKASAIQDALHARRRLIDVIVA
jgi:hypothetical protein